MNTKKKRLHSERVRNNSRVAGIIFFVAVIAIFLVLGGRFLYVAGGKEVKGHNLSTAARKIYMQTQVVNAKRGDIFDQSGGLLAENTNIYSIYAVLNKQQRGIDGKPMYVVDKDKTATVLSKYLKLSKKQILKALNPVNHNAFQVEFGNAGSNLSIETHDKILAEKLPGIAFTKQPARLYPNGIFASHLIGIAQPTLNEKTGAISLIGTMGIEKEYNTDLAGHNGIKEIKAAPGYSVDDSTKGKPVKNGDDVYTTLDSKLQTLLESEMTRLQSQSNPVDATAMVMDARTGAIVAATQRPTFDATTRVGIDKLWQNLLVESAYEPGSTMKVLTLSAAIDSGNWHPKALYQSGTYLIDGQKVTDWDPKGWGMIPYKQGFARSSNVAMAHVEQQMGPTTWKKYLEAFHMNKSTDSGLANETAGGMQFQYPIEQANTAFGQGIRVTPMQMMQAFSAVAGNGQELKPYFIDKVVDPATKKVIYSGKRTVIGEPIKATTAKKVRKVMQDVVYKSYGTGISYKIPGFKVAGKTGTAQISTAKGYTVGDENVIHSWVGMVPANKPRYVMYITLNQPHRIAEPISKSIANVFRPVMEQALKMDESHQTETSIAIVPDVRDKTVENANKLLTKAKFLPVVIGNGKKVTRQFPDALTEQLEAQRIFMDTGGSVTMPNMMGWTKNDALTFASLAKIQMVTDGAGFITKQSIKSGTVLQPKQEIQVKLN
ncbi:penicillin-binding protein [Periweissella cryptocerci]|uniref:Penicillin-binding protein n=1 Tax=Periweissella cryptocerci TaxID=2506420 RepID=A0A4P6YS55_9LACO|nr:penicillin-binding transpeptidase domain-containing protein [Periweissella cryptocerci]QBO35443.1 penicillin-binding protein [Periweissella cryptocerci]